MITITEADTHIHVSSPYDPEFVTAAKSLAGKWDSDQKTWAFDSRDRARVHILLEDIYGWVEPVVGERLVTVRITVGNEGLDGDRAPVTLGGVTLARARSRDSGATLGDSVVLLSGRIGSGGSHQYWTTYIAPNSVIEVRDVGESVAKGMVKHAEEMAIESVEIVDDRTADRDALIARKNTIEQNIASLRAELDTINERLSDQQGLAR